MNEGSKALHDGEALASVFMPVIQQQAENFSPEESVLWWAGFLGVMMGYCGASLGPGAAEVIGQTLQRMVGEITKGKVN